ncbi:glycoside hydrolase superfamily [Zopfochytrium polystomum]|nr:glycoside hydrolase superfamily [Zopfochytrium polystomum]
MFGPKILVALAVLATAASASPTVGDYNKYRTWSDAIKRAKQDVAKLTLREKVVLTTGLGWGWAGYHGNPEFSTSNLAAGQFLLSPGWTGEQAVCVGNLGKDSPTGVRFGTKSSAFSSALNVAATFDRDLMRRRGEAMGEEFRGKGIQVSLQPCVNFMRTPNGGRGWEGFGADPYLQSENVVRNVHGVQSKGVQTTVKHYILNDDEYYRKSRSINIDMKTFHETYLRPFKAAVDADTTAIMASYNRINGVFSEQNPDTFSILKDELGFKGYVMTDWWGGHSTKEAALAGLDMQMAGGDNINDNLNSRYGDALIAAVNSGDVPISRVDDMVVRILSSYYKLGQDDGFPKTNMNVWNHTLDGMVDVQGDHKKVIRDVGAASAILLKNADGVLPVTSKKYKTIALIGFGAGPEEKDVQKFLDNFNFGSGWGYIDLYDNSGDGNHGDHGSLFTKDGIYGNIAQGWGSGTTYFPYLVTPLKAFSDKAGNKFVIKKSLSNYDLASAKKVAAESDIAFVFGSASSGEQYINYESSGGDGCTTNEYEQTHSNPGDRRNLTLWWNGDDLVNAVADSNKNTVVVLNGPGAFLMPWVDKVKAIIHHHFPGQESGNGLADVVFGDVNPSGRLPYTIAKKLEDYPALTTVPTDPYCSDKQTEWKDQVPYKNTDYSEGNYIDYRYYDKSGVEPLFPFGHGLSYTTFAYSNLGSKVVSSDLSNPKVTVTVDVKNTGDIAGWEVAQLYLGFPSVAGQPIKQLRGFDRSRISSGNTKTFSFDLEFDELSYWDGKYKVASGTYKVYVGASSKDIRQTGTFTL